MKALKMLAFLLALLLTAGLFSACTGSDGQQGSSGGDTLVANSEVDTSISDEYVYRMPITDGETFTYWVAFSSTVIDSPAEKYSLQELERRTGVHIEWQLVSTTSANEAFNLMVMGGDLTDMIGLKTNYYTGGMDKAIEDGVYTRLNEYLTKWAPNFLTMMNRSDQARRMQITDQGNIAYCGNIANAQPAWVGPMVRQDWVEEAGLAMPVTYDDWHAMLQAFKTNHSAVMSLGNTGYNTLSQSMNAGFDVGQGFYNEEGTVKFGFIEDGFRDYLALMNQWYQEGLIDHDFHSRTSWIADTSMITDGTYGAFDHIYTMPGVFAALSGDPNFKVKAVPNPVKQVGNVAHFRRVNYELGDDGTAITPKVLDNMDRFETALRWIDYWYTDEGSELITYGILGESYDYDENGEPQYLPIVTQNPDGLSFGDACEPWRVRFGGQFYRWECENISVSPEDLEAYDIWDQADGAWVMPLVTLTTEEGTEYSSLYGDIETYVQENIPGFIIGTKPLTEWDNYVAQIKAMNIDRCIELQQAALTRYLAR